MQILNEELYLINLESMTEKELVNEEFYCRMRLNKHRVLMEDRLATLMEERLRCLNKYKQMLEILNV